MIGLKIFDDLICAFICDYQYFILSLVVFNFIKSFNSLNKEGVPRNMTVALRVEGRLRLLIYLM